MKNTNDLSRLERGFLWGIVVLAVSSLVALIVGVYMDDRRVEQGEQRARDSQRHATPFPQQPPAPTPVRPEWLAWAEDIEPSVPTHSASVKPELRGYQIGDIVRYTWGQDDFVIVELREVNNRLVYVLEPYMWKTDNDAARLERQAIATGRTVEAKP